MHDSSSSESLSSLFCLRRVAAQDIRVTCIEDSHGRASEELSAGSAQFDLYFNVLSANVTLHSQHDRGLLLRAQEVPSRAMRLLR